MESRSSSLGISKDTAAESNMRWMYKQKATAAAKLSKGKWEWRWFKIEEDQLRYYDSAQSEKPRNPLPLSEILSVSRIKLEVEQVPQSAGKTEHESTEWERKEDDRSEQERRQDRSAQSQWNYWALALQLQPLRKVITGNAGQSNVLFLLCRVRDEAME